MRNIYIIIVDAYFLYFEMHKYIIIIKLMQWDKIIDV